MFGGTVGIGTKISTKLGYFGTLKSLNKIQKKEDNCVREDCYQF